MSVSIVASVPALTPSNATRPSDLDRIQSSAPSVQSSPVDPTVKPWQIVEGELLKSLSAYIPADQNGAAATPKHFSVHNVAAALESALTNNSSSGDLVPPLRDALNKGFDNAHAALTKAGLDDQSADAAVARFRSRLSDVLDQAAQATRSDVASNSAATASSTAIEYTRNDSLRLTIKTQDGDTAAIRLRSRDALQYTAGDVTYGNASFASKSLASLSSNHFALEVQGNLSDAELSAISDVVQQAQELANQFFSGDIQQAFSSSAAVHADAGEIASVALKLSTKETLRVRSVSTSLPARAASATNSPPTAAIVANKNVTTPASTAPAETVEPTIASENSTTAAPTSSAPVSKDPDSATPIKTLTHYLKHVLDWAHAGSDNVKLVITSRTKLQLVSFAVQLTDPATKSTSAATQLFAKVIGQLADQPVPKI